MSNAPSFSSRRCVTGWVSAAFIGSPFINRGCYVLFAQSGHAYAGRAVRLVRESLVAFCAVTVLFSSNPLQAQQPTKEDVAELMRKYYSAWDSGNVDAVLQSPLDRGGGFGFRTAAPRSPQGVDAYRRTVKGLFDAMEYFHIKLEELHTSVEGDIGLAWGTHTEDFKLKGRSPERVRVRFTQVLKMEAGSWRSLIYHRDSQPFDGQGRYMPHLSQTPPPPK